MADMDPTQREQLWQAARVGHLTDFRQQLARTTTTAPLGYHLGECFYVAVREGHFGLALWLSGQGSDYTVVETAHVKVLDRYLQLPAYYMYGLDNILPELSSRGLTESVGWLSAHYPQTRI